MIEIPRYKQEIEASGLSQKEWYAKVYLKSEHWKALKKAKAKEAGRKCEICGATKKLEFHHDNYRDIYDVTTADLRILCKTHHREFHFGTGKKKSVSVDVGMLDFTSTDFQKEVASLISGLRKAMRNQQLNIIIKEMRRRKMGESAINSIIILKSGKKARLLKSAINGRKWTAKDFENHWYKFKNGRRVTSQMCAEFQTIFKSKLRARHVRRLASMAENS